MTKVYIMTITIAVTLVILGLFMRFQTTYAAEEPKFLISWQTNTYAPAEYPGKILPTANSQIAVSFELMDGGKFADLSKETVYWYLNDDFFMSGQGLQEIVFQTPDINDVQMRVRAQLPHYKNRLLMKSIDIPVVSPKVVIERDFEGVQLNSRTVIFSAIPYFFNINHEDELLYDWHINGESPKDQKNPKTLSLEIPKVTSPTPLTLQLTASLPSQIYERAVATLNLTITP